MFFFSLLKQIADSNKIDRSIEIKKNPIQNDEGPYDAKIKTYIDRMHEMFKGSVKMQEIIDLIGICLQYNPKNRKSFPQLSRTLSNKKLAAYEKENNNLRKINEELIESNKLLLQRFDNGKKI